MSCSVYTPDSNSRVFVLLCLQPFLSQSFPFFLQSFNLFFSRSLLYKLVNESLPLLQSLTN